MYNEDDLPETDLNPKKFIPNYQIHVQELL